MTAFFLATALVALAEMGDKTQLLAFVLAARFRKPLPIIAGIFVATIANHAGAGLLGSWISHWLGGEVLRWLLGIGFLAMAAWMLVPDELDEDAQQEPRFGVFFTTIMAFFMAEMGDKTQIATVALAARYAQELVWVVAGTTLGMMLANVPAVYLGNHFAQKLPLRWIHGIAAAIFAVIGVLALAGVGQA